MASAATVTWMMMGTAERAHGVAASVRPALDRVARLAGFGIDMVVLTGHRLTADSDIYDALDLANARSLMSFDTEGVRRRLERLPWVASAEVSRVFPDRLDVRITERKAFAVWRRGNEEFLIDASGRVLSPISTGMALDLPRFAGEGAAAGAYALTGLLASYPDIARRVQVAERVEGRRWTLKLAGGVTLHLPADSESAALEIVSKDGAVTRLVNAGNHTIDLRTPGRVAVRQTVGASADGHPPKAGS